MRFFKNLLLAITCFGIAIFVGIAGAHAQEGLRRIALKSGESVELRSFYFTINCQSIAIGTPVLDVLEGPPELTVAIKEGMVLALAEKCAKPVPGGTLVATAKDIEVPKEAKLTIRLKYKTKVGDRQSSSAYIVSLFP
jgi:hypothetical protein